MLPISKSLQSLKAFAKKSPPFLIRHVRKAVALVIRAYQKSFSPDHGLPSQFYPYGFCRFYPSCSEYGRQAVLTMGVMKGFIITIYRVVRCNPWNRGGTDPIL